MKNWLLKIRNRKHYKNWKAIKEGHLPIHYVKRFNPWSSTLTYYSDTEKWECISGKTGIWKKTKSPIGSGLYDNRDYAPSGFLDYVFSFIGFENEKPIKDCSFKEYLSIYGHSLKFTPGNL